MRKIVVTAALVPLVIMLFSILRTDISTASAETPEYPVYETLPPTTDIFDIASSVFNISDPKVEEVDGLFYVNSSYPRYLEVYEASGSIWYADFSKMYNESYEPNLPTEQDALAKAQAFLEEHDLLPTNAYLAGFGNTTTSILEADTNEIKTVNNSLNVIFGFNTPDEIAPDSVDGPGAKIRISLGDGGEIIGFHRVWRELDDEWNVYPAITEDEAIEMLRERFKAEHKAGFEIADLESRLAYYGAPEDLVQTYVQPYYIFDGIIVIDEEQLSFQTQMIPATSFSPRVSIDSPIHGERLLANQAIPFEASVQYGTEPYSYRWEICCHNITLLNESVSFETALPCGNEFRDVLVPYTIVLTVADSNGIEATDYISIIVTVINGDIDGDGKVNILDISRAAAAFGSSPGHPRWDLVADLNNDDQINIIDIAGIATQFGQEATKSAVSSSFNYYARRDKSALWFTMTPLVLVILFLPTAISSKRVNERKKRSAGLLLMAIIVASVFVTSLPSVSAQPNDDENLTEVGLETAGGDLAYEAISSAAGFKNTLEAKGWAVRFQWYEWWAWEEDFKYRNGEDGGTDFDWIDTVDFAYYCGHGNPRCIAFLDDKHDSDTFWFTNARWGGTAGGNAEEDADLEWMALESCLTLRWRYAGENVFIRWRQAFSGLHYILGFHTVAMATGKLGQAFAQNLVLGYTVRLAWIRATQQVQPSYIWGAYLRAGNSTARTYDDHLPGVGYVSPDPWNWTYLAYMRWPC